MKKKKLSNKYEQSPEAVLDLHGLFAMEAEQEVLEFFEEVRTEELKQVRIITGKGEGVLQNLVKRMLNERDISYRPAKLKDGGEGAFEVTM